MSGKILTIAVAQAARGDARPTVPSPTTEAALAGLQRQIDELRAELVILRGPTPRRMMAPLGYQEHWPIVDRVCEYFGFARNRIFGTTRTETIAWARHLAWYLMERELGLSYSEIGRLLDFNPGTVRHGIHNVANRIEQRDRRTLTHLRELQEAARGDARPTLAITILRPQNLEEAANTNPARNGAAPRKEPNAPSNAQRKGRPR